MIYRALCGCIVWRGYQLGDLSVAKKHFGANKICDRLARIEFKRLKRAWRR